MDRISSASVLERKISRVAMDWTPMYIIDSHLSHLRTSRRYNDGWKPAANCSTGGRTLKPSSSSLGMWGSIDNCSYLMAR